MKIFPFSLFLLFPAFCGAIDFETAMEVRKDNFAELHQLMQPRPEELKWRAIPWHSNLWEARREAARTGKPIYLWEMDGHPLGCT